jgi:hypothetical protein
LHLKFVRYCSRFFCWPWKEKILFAEAVFFLFSAKIMLLLLPFRVCIKTLTSNRYETQPPGETLSSIKLAVVKANRLSFWKNICLVQAFAARWMLQRRKIDSSLSIGIKPDSKSKLSAHAWLMVGKKEIVSGGKDYLSLITY